MRELLEAMYIAAMMAAIPSVGLTRPGPCLGALSPASLQLGPGTMSYSALADSVELPAPSQFITAQMEATPGSTSVVTSLRSLATLLSSTRVTTTSTIWLLT